MRIFITGATGFIGGAIAARLRQDGHEVTALCRSLARGGRLKDLGVHLVQGDVTDPASIAGAVQGCEAVVHAAGVPRPTTYATFHGVHVEGTRHVARAAKGAGARMFIHIASHAVVFGGQDLEGDESLPYPVRFVDAYSETKALGEQAALAESTTNFRTISLRPGTVWGPGDTTILPTMCKLARGLGIPIVGDGSNLESTTYIEHIPLAVTGALAALQRADLGGRVYFLSDPDVVTFKQIIGGMVEAAGVRPRFMRVPRMLAEPGAWALDTLTRSAGLPIPLALFGVRIAQTSRRWVTDRAQRELGWNPTVTFAEGMRRLREWSSARAAKG